MPEVDITDAELLRRARNGYDLTREEKVRLHQLTGEPAETDVEPEHIAPAPAVKKRGRPRKAA